MMNKIRSARLHLLRFLFILPLLAILLVAFRDRNLLYPVPASSRFLTLAPPRHVLSHPAADTVPHGHDTLKMSHDAGKPTGNASKPDRDTNKPKRDISKPGSDMGKPDVGKMPDQPKRDWRKALWVVDGVTMPVGWNGLDSIPPQNIARMSILKDEQATELFGKAGANGVVAVLTKSGQKGQLPLYIIDGTMYQDNPPHVDPSDIASVMVLKREAAKAQYGEKGRYGVVQITTKHSTRPHVVLETTDSSGKPMTMIVDSLYTPEGKIHAGNPRPKQ